MKHILLLSLAWILFGSTFAQTPTFTIGEEMRFGAAALSRFMGFWGEESGSYFYATSDKKGWSVYKADKYLSLQKKVDFPDFVIGKMELNPSTYTESKGITASSDYYLWGSKVLFVFSIYEENAKKSSFYVSALDLETLAPPATPVEIYSQTSDGRFSPFVVLNTKEAAFLIKSSSKGAWNEIRLDPELKKGNTRTFSPDLINGRASRYLTDDGALIWVQRDCEKEDNYTRVCEGSLSVVYLGLNDSEPRVIQELSDKVYKGCESLLDGSTLYMAGVYGDQLSGPATGSFFARYVLGESALTVDYRAFTADKNTFPGANEDPEGKNPAELGYDDYKTFDILKGSDGNVYALHQMYSNYMGTRTSNGVTMNVRVDGYGDVMITRASAAGKIEWNSRTPLYQSSSYSRGFGASLFSNSDGVYVILNDNPKAVAATNLKGMSYMKRIPDKGDRALYAIRVGDDGSFKHHVLSDYSGKVKFAVNPRLSFHVSNGTLFPILENTIYYPALVR
ncbi:MAG: hypothetical protein ACK500_09475 [Flavobacteriales bacterium]